MPCHGSFHTRQERKGPFQEKRKVKGKARGGHVCVGEKGSGDSVLPGLSHAQRAGLAVEEGRRCTRKTWHQEARTERRCARGRRAGFSVPPVPRRSPSALESDTHAQPSPSRRADALGPEMVRDSGCETPTPRPHSRRSSGRAQNHDITGMNVTAFRVVNFMCLLSWARSAHRRSQTAFWVFV